MNPLERRHIQKTSRIAQQYDAVAVPTVGHRVEPPLGNSLGPPLHHLTPFEVAPEQGMELHLLKQGVHVEPGLTVIEAHHQTDRHHIRLQRIHEASAEGIVGKRPAQCVNHGIERSLGFPNFLDSECIYLRILRIDVLPLLVRLGQGPTASLRQRGDLRGDVRSRHVAGRLVPIPIQARGSGAHTDDSIALDQEFFGRVSHKNVDAQILGLLAQPAHYLAERGDIIALVVHRRGRGNPYRPRAREHVYGFLFHRLPERKVVVAEIGKEVAKRRGVHYGARQAVLAKRRSFFQHADGDFSNATARSVVRFYESGQFNSARQPARSTTHEENVHHQALLWERFVNDELIDR